MQDFLFIQTYTYFLDTILESVIKLMSIFNN